MPFPSGWPPRPATNNRTGRFYVAGTGTANYADNAFLFADANVASGAIGNFTDEDSWVLVSTVETGPEANRFQTQVIRPSAGPSSLSATLADDIITVSLAVLADGQLNTAGNTASLVATAVDALTGINAVANGAGTGSLTRPESLKHLIGGGGLPKNLSPVVLSGSSVPVNIGTSRGSGLPMGDNRNIDVLSDEYAPTPPMNHMATIKVFNDGANPMFWSFDGINDHGQVLAGQTAELLGVYEAGISVRGVGAFRIVAY